MKNFMEVNTIKETEEIGDAGLALATKTALHFYLEAYGVGSLADTSEEGEPQKIRVFAVQRDNVIESLVKPFDIEHSEIDDDGYCKIMTIEQELDQARAYIVHQDNVTDEGIRKFFERELED
jgi:hypothetical protein